MTTAATLTAAPPQRSGFRWLMSTMGAWLIAIGFAAFCWFGVHGGVHGLDARAYWGAARHSLSYAASPGAVGAYLYPPPLATVIWPLARLPLAAFVDVWMALEAAAFAWLLKPLGWRWGVPAFLLCFAELIVGNINAFLASAMVVGFRVSGAWALPVLTKIAPGVGMLWFAVRHEWRALGYAVGTTAAVAAVSAFATPHLWVEWWRFATSHAGQAALLFPLRLSVALLTVAVAARRRRPWLLAPALILAQPIFEVMSLTLLSAIPRLVILGRDAREQVA